MRQLSALAWKEWREFRWVLGFSLAVFIGLPLAFGMQAWRFNHRIDFYAWPLVALLGGFLATVAASMAVCRDLNGPLAEFWRSQPVRSARWLVIKYFVGLIVMLLACLAPLGIEAWIERGQYPSDVRGIAVLLPYWWAAQYALGFVCGCFIRRTGPAVMLALAIALLVYFSPYVLPSLNGIMDDKRELMRWSIAVFGGLTVLSLALGITAVRWNWKIRANRGLMYGSVAATVLLLFASVSFQVATNLPVLQQIDPGPNRRIVDIQSDGRRGMVLIEDTGQNLERNELRSIDFTASSIRLGPRVPLPDGSVMGRWPIAWLAKFPDRYFFLKRVLHSNYPTDVDHVELLARSLTPGVGDLASPLRLTIYDAYSAHSNDPEVKPVNYQSPFTADSWLCARWSNEENDLESAAIDVARSGPPRIVKFAEGKSARTTGEGHPNWVILLPRIPGMSAYDRLTVTMNTKYGVWAGNVYSTPRWNYGLTSFRLARLARTISPEALAAFANVPHPAEATDGYAALDFAGEYVPSAVERLMADIIEQMSASGHLVYVSAQTYIAGGSSRITVFDVSNPAKPRPVGHFALPHEQSFSICPLPDGRVLVGGQKLYLLGPPPGR